MWRTALYAEERNDSLTSCARMERNCRSEMLRNFPKQQLKQSTQYYTL
jgi:hypothetical protein